jgi:hypothetical protein
MRSFGIAGAAAGLVLPLLAAGTAHSAALKTGYYTIAHMAMVSDGVSIDTNYTIDWAGSLRNLAPDPACFNAAINLPNGATITRVTVWYSNKTTTKVHAGLLRNELADGKTVYVAEKNLNDTSGQRKGVNLSLPPKDAKVTSAAAQNAVVDNARFSYGFGICLNGESKAHFYAARVTYKYAD